MMRQQRAVEGRTHRRHDAVATIGVAAGVIRYRQMQASRG
jgi:hypothetical protein